MGQITTSHEAIYTNKNNKSANRYAKNSKIGENEIRSLDQTEETEEEPCGKKTSPQVASLGQLKNLKQL